MKSKHIFLLNRDGRVSLLSGLSPLDFVNALREGRITGLYGTYPDIKEIEQVKGELYILGGEGGRIGLAEKTFYARFFLSLLVFLVIFYILVYLVPDPIPLVDEVAIGLTGAILFSFWHRRRMERGDRMVRERIDIKGEVNGIEFNESPLLKEIELYLESLDARNIDRLGETWLEGSVHFSSEDTSGLLPELIRGIEKKIKKSALKRFRTIMNSLTLKESSKGNAQKILQLEKLLPDPSLAILYWKLIATL